ncbi:hypothetical protein Glove_350g64 [Diversispora epigaea]|uniref:Reverse transcriptase domain-containing protein n=1 Tax=Diversispora epigaea TaxID=1348612 RepID=A0A397HFW7_9GLOM|nr:hypothetical protein Glove_350g64 [Diversispora epigaea]
MSKTFDSISAESLVLALLLTSYGNTLAYNVEDGIDQGDIISSLFWQIFYNPLKKLTVQVSVAAYIDDTNWITPNKQNMEEILTIVNEFYQMNNITINKSKLYLIAINANPQTKSEGILMGDEMLYPVADDYLVRSLGVYVTKNGKPITNKQAIYIFNAVVILMLEYSLNDMTLLEKECLKITTKFISMIKNKTLLPITTPNTLIHAKKILNDKSMLGCSTRVCLQHLQNSFWSGQSITESLFTMKTKRRWSLLNDILALCIRRQWSVSVDQEKFAKQAIDVFGTFRMLENKLLTNIKTRMLSAELQATLGEQYNICNWNIGKQNTNINWVADEITEELIDLLKKNEKFLEKYTGCIQGDRSLVANLKNQDIYLIKTNILKSVNFDFVYLRNVIRDGISKIIEDSLPTKLDNIRLKLSSSMSIRIYTNGSLIKRDNNNSHVTIIGCGWCALDENNTKFNFSGKVENFASSTRAKLMVILMAVYTTPKHSRLCIFTDS